MNNELQIKLRIIIEKLHDFLKNSVNVNVGNYDIEDISKTYQTIDEKKLLLINYNIINNIKANLKKLNNKLANNIIDKLEKEGKITPAIEQSIKKTFSPQELHNIKKKSEQETSKQFHSQILDFLPLSKKSQFNDYIAQNNISTAHTHQISLSLYASILLKENIKNLIINMSHDDFNKLLQDIEKCIAISNESLTLYNDPNFLQKKTAFNTNYTKDIREDINDTLCNLFGIHKSDLNSPKLLIKKLSTSLLNIGKEQKKNFKSTDELLSTKLLPQPIKALMPSATPFGLAQAIFVNPLLFIYIVDFFAIYIGLGCGLAPVLMTMTLYGSIGKNTYDLISHENTASSNMTKSPKISQLTNGQTNNVELYRTRG